MGPGRETLETATMPDMLFIVLVRWIILAVAVGVTAWLMPGVTIDGGPLALIGVAALYGLVNALIGPIARLLALPVTMVTFGLFALVINGLLLALTAGLSGSLDVGGFGAAIVAAILISLFSTLLQFVVMRQARFAQKVEGGAG
jgi:putative membrane protein